MNPWIKSGVRLLIRNAVRAGMYKRCGKEACLRGIPIEDIAQEALGQFLGEFHKEIGWMSQKAYRIRATAFGDPDREASADILDRIAEAAFKLIDDYQKEKEENLWRMF